MRSGRSGFRSAMALIMLAPIAAGCSARTFTSGDESLPPVVNTPPGAPQTRPIEAYRISAADLRTIDAARGVLNSECAERFGVTSTWTPYSEWIDETTASRRYGISNREEAAEFGYRVPTSRDTALQSATEASWTPDQSEHVIMTGVLPGGAPPDPHDLPSDNAGNALPRGGCFAETESALRRGGAGHTALALLDSLESESFHLAETDPRTRRAWHKWSLCMRDLGHAYEDPWQPNDYVWGDAVTVQEQTAAVDDVDCREATDMTSTWAAVERAYQVRMEQEHLPVLRRIQSSLNVMAQNARTVLVDTTDATNPY